MSIQPAAGVPQWTLGDRLRKARESAGLEQTELAQSLGASRKTIGNAERGQHQPRRSLVMAWALATNVPVRWLMTGESPSSGDDGDSQPLYTPWDSNPEPSDSGPGSNRGAVVPLPQRLDLGVAA